MILLSVIIPVYKTEKTLDRCVQSVLSQNVEDMEVILVDDGSPDRCPEKCDEWARKDSRIKVIHKENGGLSSARNAALDIAGGQYITFVDSDDYLVEGTYPRLMSIIDGSLYAEILEFSTNCIGWEKVDVKYENHLYKAKDYYIKTRAWNHAYVWNKIYRSHFFMKMRFPEGKLYEDLWLLPDIINYAIHIATCDIVAYNYCANPDAISSNPDSENLKQCLAAEQNAARSVKVPWYRKLNLYMNMLYRQVDIYRLSGEIVLKWPLVRFICWVHKKTKGRGKVSRTV